MKKQKKVYDYNQAKVEKKLVTVLKKRKNESTVADLIAATGLPNHQVNETMARVVWEYSGQMKVTESGEILYYFPRGMKNVVNSSGAKIRRGLRKTAEKIGRVLSLLFKIWIMVTLIGYFVLFVALLLLALFASVAASASSKDSRGSTRSRGGGFVGFYLTSQIFRIFLSLLLYSRIEKSSRRGAWAPPQKKKKDPLHLAVFSFVFGTGREEQKAWPERLRRAFIVYVQDHQGIVTLEELMNLSGLNFGEANRLMSVYLLEYGGEPDVTDEGTLVYRFSDLLRTGNTSEAVGERDFYRKKKPLIRYSKNKSSINKWIGFFNGFNLVFGTYFMIFSGMIIADGADPLSRFYLMVQTLTANVFSDPGGAIFIVLGIVPFIFSLLFYLIPFVRRQWEKKENRKIREQNFRKHINNRIYDNPEKVDPEALEPAGGEEAVQNSSVFRDKYIAEYAAEKQGDVTEKSKDRYIYRFPELLREQEDLLNVRKNVDMSEFNLGGVVFDSGEDSEKK